MVRFAKVVGVALWGVLAAHPAGAKPPNIVLVLADDLGFSDPAPYGSEIHTPHLSELAARGVRFTNYHTAASCAPTRGMLLTGVDSHRNGVPNIPESIPPDQAKHANYRGTLNHQVVTVATRLRDAGYHTYMAGKWHLGRAPDELPFRRGFERTVAMADTGADNWEQKTYLPIYDEAHWYADGEKTTLPEDFYSSKFLIDKTIEFIESNREDGRPFFSYIPFQAVHIPVQAPAEFTEKYLGRYDEGWGPLRAERLRKARELGLVPPGTKLAPVPTTADWDALSPEDKRYASKKMAVYAGMIEAMDHHLGRLIAYLREHDRYDDTVFLFLSDNGPESTQPLDVPGGRLFSFWLATHGYNTDYDTLGTRGSFVYIGPSFASAAASPLAYYKFFAHEGGMRVPLIVAGPGVAARGGVEHAFAWVNDITPTLLELAGAPDTGSRYAGREVEPIVGKSLLPLLRGEVDRIHPPDEAIGYELGGNAALFQGDLKIVKDRGPVGDGEWHLYDFVSDPGEARDLRDARPAVFARMQQEYRTWADANGVLPVPEGYDQRREVLAYGLRNRVGPGAYLTVALVLATVVYLLLRRFRRA